MNKELKKRLIFYPCFFIVIGVSSYLWGPAFVQSRNMKQAQQEIELIKQELGTDPRFSELAFLRSTSNLGKDIIIKGSVPDESSLNYLKSLMGKKISDKFVIRFIVQVQQGSRELSPTEVE